MKLTEEVRPEHAFYFADGSSLKSLKELAGKLKKAEHSHYVHHASPERNDFHNWIKDVYMDEKLAKKILAAKNGAEAAAIIEKEIKKLSGQRKTAAKATAKAKKTRKPKKRQLRVKNRKPKKAAKAEEMQLRLKKRKTKKLKNKKEKYKNSKAKGKTQRKRKSMRIRSYLKVFAQKYGLI